MKKVLPLVGALIAAACTYQTPVSFAPAFDAAATVGQLGQRPGQRIEGRYVLIVGGIENLSRRIRSRGLSCSSFTYRVDIGPITRESISQVLEPVFEDLRIAAAAPTREEMREQNIVGVIRVRVERFTPWLSFSNGTSVLTNLDLSLTVDGVGGPLFATSVTTARRAEARTDASCEGAAEAIARSAEFALQDTLGRLVDQLLESEELTRVTPKI